MTVSRIEEIILSNLVGSDSFCRKVLPFLEDKYFSVRVENIVFKEIRDFFAKYNKLPNQQVLKIAIDDLGNLKQDDYDEAMTLISNLGPVEQNQQWLVERTEKFCRDQAIFIAITDSIAILDGKNTKFNKEAIPSLLQEALAVSFDNAIGHDYFEDADARYESYHLKQDKLPFDLDMFNRITNGGLPKKTLSCILAGTGVGKSLSLCHIAASTLKQGKNVLYITLEMAEEKLAERVDCNLLDVDINDLPRMSKDEFSSRLNKLKRETHGKIVFKEYPTSAGHVGHFRHALEELRVKKGFVPDLVIVDYINICCSQRYKNVATANSYFIVKAIAEELRGLAVEYNVPIITATQTTRTGFSNTDVEMGDTSESFGLPMTLDFMVAIIRTEELDAMGQLMVKQLKSRLGDINYYKKFCIGVDIKKFKLFDVDQPTKDLSGAGKTEPPDTPLYDRSKAAKTESFGLIFE